MKLGFDNHKYVKIQSECIKERITHFENKLYFLLLLSQRLAPLARPGRTATSRDGRNAQDHSAGSRTSPEIATVVAEPCEARRAKRR